MTHRQAILETIADSPPLLDDGYRMISRLQDPECDLVMAADFIRGHAGLSGALLRLANSSYFGSPRSIHTVWEAILRLGTNHVFKIAMSMALQRASHAPLTGFGLSASEFLTHAAATAMLAEALACEMDRPTPHYLFTAALLHDVGKISISRALPKTVAYGAQLNEAEAGSRCALERKLFGIDHAEAGALTLEAWNLPLEIVAVVGAHHDPVRGDAHAAVLEVLSVANTLSHSLELGQDACTLTASCRAAAHRLNLDRVPLERALRRAARSLQLWMELFTCETREVA